MNAKKKPAEGPAQAQASNTQEVEASSTQHSTDSIEGLNRLPKEFGRYRLLKELGVGGMGTVYLAHDTELDRKVALKLPHLGKGNRTQIERFRREARLSATLDHPNICRVYDFGEHQGRLYLTMAYIQGNTLHETIRAQGAVPPRVAVNLVRGIAKAVGYAHAQGIIHRDLKPANIMIMKNQQFVIMDFGLARRIEQSDEQVTIMGAVLGTPSYMAPEQLRGENLAIGPHSDVYSLGIILYELLVGERAFQGTLPQIYSQVLTADSIAPSDELGIDPVLCEICRKATHSQIAQRYSSAAELAVDLESYRAGSSTVDSNKSIVPSIAIARPLSLSSSSVRSTPALDYRKRNRSTRVKWIGGMAACSALMFATAFLLTNKQLSDRVTGLVSMLTKLPDFKSTAPTPNNLPLPLGDVNSSAEKASQDTASAPANVTAPDNAPNNTPDNVPNNAPDVVPAKSTELDDIFGSPTEGVADAMPVAVEPTTAEIESPVMESAVPTTTGSTPAKNTIDKRKLKWSRAMVSAKEAIMQSDFDSFRKHIAIAQLQSPSPEEAAKIARLSQLGTLQERIITLLRQTKAKEFVLENRTDKGKVRVQEVTDTSIKVQDGAGEYTLSWLKLDPQLVRKIVTPKLDVENADDFAAWATYLKLNRFATKEPDNSDALLARSVGKGSVRPDFDLVFSDTYDVPIEPSPVSDESYALLSGKTAGEIRAISSADIKLVWIEPGTFMMGSPATEAGRGEYEDQVAVTLTRGFWLSPTEVTRSQWKGLMNTEPWQVLNRSGQQSADIGELQAVNMVSWNDCMDFLDELQEREAGNLPDGWRYTLPTEAQWEYACRAGSETRFAFGDDETELSAYAWYYQPRGSGGGRVNMVGQKRPNAFGLFDMHGNVEEWCRDAFVTTLAGGSNPLSKGVHGLRVVRGGNFQNEPSQCRSAQRHAHLNYHGQNLISFRIALVPQAD